MTAERKPPGQTPERISFFTDAIFAIAMTLLVTVSWITTGYWVLTLALVWWTPWTGIPWLFTSLFATLVRSVMRRRRLRSAPV